MPWAALLPLCGTTAVSFSVGGGSAVNLRRQTWQAWQVPENDVSTPDSPQTDTAEGLVPGWLTLPEVGEALNLPVTRVRQLVAERQLLAFRRGESRALMVPADFVQDGRVLKSLPGVLMLLHDARYSEDEALRWLYTDDDLPGSPVRALTEDRGTEIKRRAQALGF